MENRVYFWLSFKLHFLGSASELAENGVFFIYLYVNGFC